MTSARYRWDFFLAHAGPSTALAKQLYARLATKSRTYLDSESLRLGDPWPVELAAAQRASAITVVLVSSATDQAYYQREEIAAAIDQARKDPTSHRVVPIYLPGIQSTSDAVPYGLRQTHGIVMKRNADVATVARRLLALLEGLQSESPNPEQVTASSASRLTFGLPDLPVHHQPRTGELAALKAALLSPERAAVGIYGVQGLGGVGKTVLASALVRDAQITAQFPDGVFWLSLGETPDLLQLQHQLTRWLDDVPSFTSAVEGREHLRTLFAERQSLLVLDDVWALEHSQALQVIGESSRLLVTTRDKQVLDALHAQTYRVDVLDVESAKRLLSDSAGVSADPEPDELAAIAKQCGYLPLALALSGAQVRDGVSWKHVLEALQEGDLAYLDHPSGSVMKAMSASVRALTEQDSARYRELVVLGEDVRMPISVITRFWSHVAGSNERNVAKLVHRFASRSLLTLHEGTPPTLSLHDLQLDYLRNLEGERSQTHHQSLLNTFSAHLPRFENGLPMWSKLAHEERYLWQHLSTHLLSASRDVELTQNITDANWLRTKIAIEGVAALVTELARVVPNLDSKDSAHIERAIRVDSAWLYAEPAALDNILYTRLRSEGWDAPRIDQNLAHLAPALRLLHPVYLGSRAELRRFEGHTGNVTSCAYSPDGRRVLSGSYDKTLREWDASSGQELRRFEGHTSLVTSCAYSPDGRRVLSGSLDKTLREWDASSAKELRRFEGHTLVVTSCAYSPDGRRVLSGSEDKTLRAWDAPSGQELRRFEGHTGVVTSCAYSPDGRRVLSGSWDKTLREWDASSGQEVRRFEGHTGMVTSCAYSPDGRRVLSGWSDKTLREWNTSSGQELRRFDGHTGWVKGCAYSPDGRRVLSGSTDKTLREWDASSGQELRRFEGHTGEVVSCAYTSDGRSVLSGSEDKTLREWDASSGQEVRRLEGHTGGVTSCAYSPDGRRVLSGSRDQTLREWDASSGKELRRFEGHTAVVTNCAYSPDGRRVLSGSWDKTLREWDASSGQELRRFEGHSDRVTSCAYSADGRRVLSGSWDKTLREWDASSGQELRRFEGHIAGITSCACNPDGRRVLLGSKDQTLREWDASSGQELRRFEGHTGWVTSCAYSPNGRRVLSGSWDKTLREWDASSGQELRRFEGHISIVSNCAYSPDGRRVLSASNDRRVRVYSTETEESVAVGYGAAPFSCVSMSGRHIVAGDDLGNLWWFELTEK